MGQRLSNAWARSVGDGRHRAGDNLYLTVRGRSRTWSFRWTRDGKAREMGLGSFPTVTLQEAQKRAQEARDTLTQGKDPLTARRRPQGLTFGALATQQHAVHGGRWLGPLKLHGSALWDLPPAEVGVQDVLAVLRPLWPRPQAQILRGRIEGILDAAKVLGLREGENPARWKGNLSHLLPRDSWEHTHHPAPDWLDVGGILAALPVTVPADCIRWQILTACRPAEARGARWDEIEGDLWRIPARRMKGRREHVVPLAAEVLVILERQHRLTGEPRIFVTSPTGTRKALERVAPGLSRHGFRSSFRDWAAETGGDEVAAELCLAHLVGDAVERAYRRSDLLERRRALLRAWATHNRSSMDRGQVISNPDGLR